MTKEQFMQEAIKEAETGINLKHGGPFGTVIVKDDKIVGRGHNEVVKNNDPTCHGEIMAIRDACKNLNTYDLENCSLYTTGYPCPMCMGAILWSNISNVYYACNTTDTENIGFRDKMFYENKQKVNIVELSRDDGLKLYNEYNKLDHKNY